MQIHYAQAQPKRQEVEEISESLSHSSCWRCFTKHYSYLCKLFWDFENVYLKHLAHSAFDCVHLTWTTTHFNASFGKPSVTQSSWTPPAMITSPTTTLARSRESLESPVASWQVRRPTDIDTYIFIAILLLFQINNTLILLQLNYVLLNFLFFKGFHKNIKHDNHFKL